MDNHEYTLDESEDESSDDNTSRLAAKSIDVGAENGSKFDGHQSQSARIPMARLNSVYLLMGSQFPLASTFTTRIES